MGRDTGPNEPIGIINGEEIPLENFRLLVDQASVHTDILPFKQLVVWNQYLRNELFQTEFDILGIDAGKDQIEQVVLLQNPSLQTAVLSMKLVFSILACLQTLLHKCAIPILSHETWKRQEANIIASARESIYFDLIQSSTSVTQRS